MRQTGTRFKHEKTDLITQDIAQHYNIMQLLLYFKDIIMLKATQLYRPHSSHSAVKNVWICLDMCICINWVNIHHSGDLLWCLDCLFRSWDGITSLSLLFFPIVYASPGHQTLNLARHRAYSFSGTHTVSYSYLLRL